MPKFTVEVNVSDEQIKAAIDKAGKLDSYKLHWLAEEVVSNRVKAKMRKAIGDLDEVILAAIEEVDWKQKVIDRIGDWAVYDD